MKKTLTINLNGRGFTIDEDAYDLLNNYLSNLGIYFRKEEGASEIIADFEARIEEIFSESLRMGHQVISIEYVESVIKQVGQPEEFEIEKEHTEEPPENKTAHTENKKRKKKLFRNRNNKMLGGVCSGLAAYIGWDTTLIRILFVILLFVSSGYFFFIYLLCWIIMPVATTAENILEMQGKEVTVENIGKVVSAEAITSNQPTKEKKGCLYSILGAFVAVIKVGAIGLGMLIGIPLLFVLGVLIFCLFGIIFGFGNALFSNLSVCGYEIVGTTATHHPIFTLSLLVIAIGIPLFLVIYYLLSHFGKAKPLAKGIKWFCFTVWIIVLVIITGLVFSSKGIALYSNSWRSSNDHTIIGNGEVVNRTDTLPIFNVLSVPDNIFFDIQLEQDTADTYEIILTGESNIIDKIEWNVTTDGKLELTGKPFNLKPHSDITIKIQAPSLKGVETESVGNISIPRKLEVPNFYIETDGIGDIDIDSLYCNSLRITTGGVGDIVTSGIANNASFETSGVGNINAIRLQAKEVTALVRGIGYIRCNPLERLDATVEGVGGIVYKSEPTRSKNITINGLGTVSLD